MDLLDTPRFAVHDSPRFHHAQTPSQPPPPPPPPLPVQALEDLDLAGELEQALASTKRLLRTAEYDGDIPLNQKAQILSTLNTILTSITKSRSEIYSAERNRALESTLIKVLKRFPALQSEFMLAYSEALGE
jgi:hypothetical protein